MKLRRNDTVWHETAKAWSLGARVICRIDNDRVKIINTLGRVVIINDHKLVKSHPSEHVHYAISTNPNNSRPIITPLPSLRKLKQRAAWYTDGVWKSRRKKTS